MSWHWRATETSAAELWIYYYSYLWDMSSSEYLIDKMVPIAVCMTRLMPCSQWHSLYQGTSLIATQCCCLTSEFGQHWHSGCPGVHVEPAPGHLLCQCWLMVCRKMLTLHELESFSKIPSWIFIQLHMPGDNQLTYRGLWPLLWMRLKGCKPGDFRKTACHWLARRDCVPR